MLSLELINAVRDLTPEQIKALMTQNKLPRLRALISHINFDNINDLVLEIRECLETLNETFYVNGKVFYELVPGTSWVKYSYKMTKFEFTLYTKEEVEAILPNVDMLCYPREYVHKPFSVCEQVLKENNGYWYKYEDVTYPSKGKVLKHECNDNISEAVAKVKPLYAVLKDIKGLKVINPILLDMNEVINGVTL